MDQATAEPGAHRVALSSEDRAILALEGALVAGHVCAVIHLAAGGPDLAALRERIAQRLPLTPALTWRLAGPVEAPYWEPDPDFDLAAHVVADGAPPIDDTQLCTVTARLFEQRLDRRRPLWRMDVIELQRGECAIVWRIHHAVADGMTAVRYLGALLADELPGRPAPRPSRGNGDGARRRDHLTGFLAREFRRSHWPSPFDGCIGASRSVGFATVPLTPLREAARAIDGAVLNDAVLSVTAGALHRWVQAHGRSVDAVRVRVPVSLHLDDDLLANRDSWFTLELPLSEPDPVARLRAIRAKTCARKAAHDAERRERLLDRICRRSPWLARMVMRLERSPRQFALSVSNVSGPREALTVLSTPMLQLFSLVEISQHHALRVSVISYADQLCFGFCGDSQLVPDVRMMALQVGPEARALVSRAGGPGDG